MLLRINFVFCVLFIFVYYLCVVCNGSVFSRNYHGIKEAFEEEIPQGASTLAFVFDITGSMYDDLVQVIEGAARILSTILARREKAIHNYVLVPFHDPDVGPVTVTTDPDLFQRHLKELYVQGGGDCPEMSVGAIKLALEVSQPNSHIYVFTDARSKDYYLLEDVLKLIQRKQSQVVFVMTGDCGNHSHPGYQAYERIASTSSGQVFHLMKSDVDEVLNFVRVSLQARKVNLFAIDRNAGDLREFEFDVDGSLREFTVSVSGESPVITVINSKGEVIDQTKGLFELLNHKNISIVNIKDPEPGRWKLRVNSEGPHTIRATGLSKIDFVHGFSRQPTENLKETYHRPLKGAPTYLLVNATELPEPATFSNVKIVDLEGNSLQNIPLHRFPGSNLFNATRFFPPDKYFYLKIAGSDELGYPIERMTSTAISAQLPDAPEVSTRPYMTGYYEEDTDLRCYVQSLVPFSVTWFKEGVQISQEQRFPQTSEVILTVPEVTMLSEGFYSCNASNVAGRTSSVIFLDVKEPPPTIIRSGNVSGILENVAVLPCVVDSVVEYRVDWSKLIPDIDKPGYVKSVQIPDDPRIIVHSNNSLVIKNLAPEDEGWYKCSASNEGGAVEESIYLHSYFPPKLTVVPPIKNFATGSFINITCEANGYPEPSIRWIWSPVHNNNFILGRSKIEGKSLIIQSAVAEDEGRYDCIGTNAAGSQAASAFLNYIEAPLISLPVKELTVKNGEQATLRCIAEGIPDPRVKWYKGLQEIQPLSYIQITPDGSLSIYDVQETDAGEYTCVAENEAGSVNETMYLNVGSKPSLIRLPNSASVEVLQNVTIPCIATGTPAPSITWLFENRTIINQNFKTSVTPEGSLLIPEADLSVVGKYICQAENKFGKEEQIVSIALTGIKKPILAPLPPTVAIPRGEKRSLPCIVLDGNPKPKVMWLRNGNPIQPGYGIEIQDGKLEILKVEEFHEANYTCVASNIGGNITEETYINVLYEPEISTSENDFEAIEGSPVILPCNVKGDPKPAIIWFKNNIELISDKHFSIGSDGNLTIKKVIENDEGEYVCSATNIVGTSDQKFKLTVKVPPKPLQPDGVSYNVTEGDMVTLPCNFYAKPPAQIYWTRITKQGSESDLEKYMMYNGSLLLKPTFEDSGKYICIAKNEVGQTQRELSLNVSVPPYANIKNPGNVIASVGDDVFLSCEASGHPQPKIYWRKDNVELFSSHLISLQDENLTIHHVSLTDAGNYECIAENFVGSSSTKRFVSIHETPRINLDYSSPQSITAVVGDKLDMICNATGYPLPKISWKEPKTFIVHHIQDNILHIPFIQESDAGIYICTAQNVAGFDTIAFNLTVHAPPVFTSHSNTEHELISGNDVSLDCSVSAEPPPEILWYRNNELLLLSPPSILSKENGKILSIVNVNISNAGQYTCVAKNSVGEISKQFQLSISEPPRFLNTRDKKISVLKNTTLRMDCSAEGFPEPIFIWRKNGQMLSALKPGLEFENSKSILKINHAQELDSGTYSCVAMNKVGSSSQDFEFLHKSKEMHLKKKSDDFQTLTLLKPEEVDTGNYSCKATNIVGDASKVEQLNILVPPHIEQQSVTETFRIKEGDVLRLNCEANGTPPPRILWLKNGQPVPLRLYQADEQVLEIQQISRKDAGRYVCVATNKVGSFEKDFSVVVLSPPKPESSHTFSRYSSPRNGKKEIMENLPFVLICPFSGYPALQFTWMKDGHILNTAINPYLTTSDGGKRLEVKHARAEHAGQFTCIAKNEAGESRKDFLVDILISPTINSDPVTQMTIPENSSLILDCNSDGNPKPSIIWLKDGTELESNDDFIFSPGNIQLEISNIEEQHSGTYVCIATNVAGSVEKEFNVDVLFSPRMNPEIEEFRSRPTAYVNKPVTLECPMSGNPLPQIRWMKNGKEINLDEEPNIYIHGDGQRLSLMRAKNEDTGKYECVAENDVGREAYQFDLEILAAPTIDKKSFKNTYYVKEGDSVVIKCPVSGYPKPIITWLKDSDIIPLHSSPHIIFSEDYQHLELKQASLKDAGKYSCIAGNEVGTAEQDFKIDVQVPPKLENLLDIPKNKSAILNKPVTISCPVSGIPPPLVKWFKDGKPLKMESNSNIMLSQNSKHLKIFRTQVSDAGTYTCKAANDVGKIEKEFQLNVQVPPSMLETNSVLDYYSEDEDDVKNELKAVENDTMQIECYVDGNPKPIILWIKDGHLLNVSNDSHYEIFHNGQVLQISDVKSSDAGHYTCVASNVAGTREKSFSLDVHVPPKLKGSNVESQEVLPNRPTVIECFVDSNPPPTITWYKDGKIIDFSSHALIKVLEEGKVLQFLKTTPDDDGQYTCVAENSVGKTEKNFKVDVFVPPTIEDKEFKSDALENEKLTMECITKGNPKPHVIWLKDGQMITEDFRANMSIELENSATILRIIEAKNVHSGLYKCIASNAAGSVEKSFDLYVKVPPRVVNTSEPNKTVFVNQPISMHCFVEAEPEASVTWTKDGLVLNDMIDPFIHILDDGQKLQILRTRDTDDGQYSCEVTNSVGNDSRFFILNVLVPPKIKNIIQEDSTINVIRGNNATISCSVSGNPQPTITWWKDKQPVYSDKVHFHNNSQLLQIVKVDAQDSGSYKCVASSPLGSEEKQYNLNVLVPPKIHDGLSDFIGHLNIPMKFQCTADGNPKPVITWMKSGQFIDSFNDPNIQFVENKTVLLIRWMRTEDAGKYTCIASSAAGQDEQNFNVHVHVPASIDHTNLEDEVLSLLNQSTILMCPATGVPFPSISWSKDGNAILRSDSKYQILEDGKVFKIISTKENDAGKYQCISSNDAGSDKVEFVLDVMVPPQVKTSTATFEQKAREGNNIILECPVEDSNYPMTISWKKNGKVFNSNITPTHIEFSPDNKKIKVMKSQAADSGIYSCTASNSAGDTEHEIDLLVKAPAKITYPSENFTSTYVKERHTITLECITVGYPQPTIRWFKNGFLVVEQHNTSFATYGKLKIANASASDVGIYSCIAENNGDTDSKFYNLTVYIPPEINVTSHGLHNVALQNTEINLECSATGVPQPRIIWYKGSQILIPGPRISFTNEGASLKISHTLPSDAGKYTCLAVNEAGDTEADHFVKIHVPPKIEKAILQGTSDPIVNQSVRIICDAHGLPFPQIAWYRNGILVDQQENRFSYAGGGKYLDILNVQSTDSGIYTCKAKNIAGEHEKDIKLSVSVPPDIDESVKSKEHHVVLGKSARIDCEASGMPPPTVTWLKNGLPLSDEDHVQLVNNNYALLFMYTSEHEAGVYTCIAVNNAGTVEQKFNFTVLVPPNFDDSSRKENLSAVIGSSGKLHCSADGYPPPDIAWSKDGNIITDDDNIAIKDGVLELTNIDLTHNGTYICEASNVAGKETKTFELNVNVPPKIEGGNDAAFVTSIANSPISMKCPISGIPTPTVMWLRNGIPITSGYSSIYQITNQGSELTFSNTMRKDSGKYMCLATNPAGNASRNFVLNVLEPPSIKKSPPLVKANVGSEAVLSCIAEGFPPPEISWMKEGSSLLLTNTPHIKLEDMSLYVSDVKLQDAGDYICIATNEAGSTTKDIKFQVAAPPRIKDSDYSQKVLSGDPVFLYCETSGHPPPLIMWHKDSIVIQDNEDMQILPDGTLHFPSANASHSGTYKCLAENEAGSHEVVRNLFILTSPKIVEGAPDTYEVIQAQPVVLQCSAEGSPSPTIAWEHNGISIDLYNPRYKVFPSGDLHISLTQSSDIGTYTCIAKNEAGSAVKNVDLIVLVPPTVKINGPPVIVAVKGRNVGLSCIAKGFPPPHINWQRNGVPITGASNSKTSRKLYLESIQPDQSGTYVCVAANSVGRDHQSVLVEVHVPPVITTLPKSQDISVGDTLSLSCEASGYPFPSVTWLLNNTQVTGGAVHSAFGRSKLLIENAGKEDEGTYICLAQNAAGERKAAAAVRVRTPPIIVDSSGVKSVKLKDTVVLDCLVKGDPLPNIIWIKNGQQLELNHRIQLITNGSLFIYNSSDQDSGQYKCVASNDFGLAEQVAELIVRSKPKFIIEPLNSIAAEGNSIQLDCRVYGEPKPTVTWTKDTLPLQKNERVVIFPNNTLKIAAVQMLDEGVYACISNNSLGSAVAEAEVIVQVHGKWSNWQDWEQCSSSCGDGRQIRQRLCNNPAPRNGGKTCIGISSEVKHCYEKPCPVNGEWGNWMDWTPCSLSCGVGVRQRSRICDNPKPQFGGSDCVGNNTEIDSCLLTKCPVDGSWSVWSYWQPCSVTCGEGIQYRTRECNNPAPQHGGSFCYGESKESQECNNAECPVHGEWGDWNEWSLCSSSCGGGTRERKRKCDSPFPAYGGHYCIGQHVQIDYCNNAECPVNGEWGPWSPWGSCSSSCNKGQKKRFRACDNPAPAGGGRECSGSAQETEICNAHLCPVDGKWSEWSGWSACSATCGIGVRSRTRICNDPDPFYGGKECSGDSEEFEECGDEACDVMPTQAVGHLIGVINGVDFGLSKLFANISQFGMEQTVSADVQNITSEIASKMKFLIPLLTPIYWTTAYEMGDAVNGYTLTKGFFRKETQVNFATGEVLYMTHVARGLDRRGKLLIDIVISGEVPDLPKESEVILHPFVEDYIQTGPGSIYALSTRTYQVGNYVLPYYWNHSIFYDEALGEMPYLNEKLYANEMDSYYDPDKQELNFIISAAIGKGSSSDECLDGFTLSSNGIYCLDINECESNPCLHICNNFPGGFSCQCLNGFTLDVDGESCLDVDECETNLAECTPSEECMNTVGSYKCLIICRDGYRRSDDDLYCLDINECDENLHLCEQTCVNTIGSYSCDCDVGYYLSSEYGCSDIDECGSVNPPCSHTCMNSPGSFSCLCPSGYEMLNNTCLDIDECYLENHTCSKDQECKNTEGGFECLAVCLSGFSRSSNGSCTDVDECNNGQAACHFSQICINTFGSYHCSCPRGYYSIGPGRPCQDINECLQQPNPCSYRCHNLPGDYECICAPGLLRLPDGKTCAGIEYLDKVSHGAENDYFGLERNRSSDLRSEEYVSINRQAYTHCPPGFIRIHGSCQDIDECEDKAKCQHLCENTQGSYRCTCPPGYRLGQSGKTCLDIDECLESNIDCGPDRMCFNMRGSYECIETPCPPTYERDPLTGYCKLLCEKAGIACPPNSRYAEVLAFKMVALPSGIQAYQDLIRLVAYDQNGVHLPNTVFSIIENETGVPFRIRLEDGKGVLYTQKSMDSNKEYQIKVQAVSFNADNVVQFTTKFLVFVSVSKYPY
ncbi:hemicentin-1 [Trichonephila inaurata madagascariensis]|uniref:Hemicentin-1 n=2 Tax=Trichonephila TaxID=2585208 RepID=A0A8X6JYZ9_9ARAC|nr:hemicentin-1 [Trichonephila inaurata madagascariensis]